MRNNASTYIRLAREPNSTILVVNLRWFFLAQKRGPGGGSAAIVLGARLVGRCTPPPAPNVPVDYCGSVGVPIAGGRCCVHIATFGTCTRCLNRLATTSSRWQAFFLYRGRREATPEKSTRHKKTRTSVLWAGISEYQASPHISFCHD